LDEWEGAVAVAAGMFAALYWISWLRVAFRTDPLVRPRARQAALLLCLVICAGMVLAILLTAADPIVRGDIRYVFLFLAVAGVALAATTAACALIGVSAIEDALRRPNPAAAWVICGLWIGTTLCVCGANIGRGDTINTTLGPLLLAVGTLIGLWGVVDALTGSAGSVSVERDRVAGTRFAALLTAWGLILGRAVAGDWESTGRTLADFAADGWPAVVLLVAVVVTERILRPSPRRPLPPLSAGLLPAAAYLLFAAAWVAWLGKP
jgi:hypothetical protein